MGRLEVLEVSLSYISKSNEILRIDSLFYAKEFLNNENLILKQKNSSLLELGAELKSFGAYSLNNHVDYLAEGIPFIRGINMKNGSVDFNDMIYISDKAHELLWKSEVKQGNILLSMSGTIGDVAIALPTWKYPLNSNQDIAKIDLRGNANNYYVYVFLLSKYGQNYLKRECRGSVQQHVFLSQIQQFKIPLFSDLLNLKIEKIILEIANMQENAKKLYIAAQNILLSELGIKDYTPDNDKVSIKNFIDSFGASGRLDAEYYQPKSDEIERNINNYKNGTEIIKFACNLYDSNFTPIDDEVYKYIELSNIGAYGEIINVEHQRGSELPTRARRKIKTNQVLVSSIEGSLNSCALITEEYNNSLCSSGFYVINSDKINSETLLILLKSIPMQVLLKRRCSGTILTAINKDEFLSIPIPIITTDIQDKMTVMIKEMYSMRKKSAALLEYAKQAVEIAIEQSEEEASSYLEDKISQCITTCLFK